ncbi:MAG TPA: YSC84-related protein [Planctomycetia bacterium]|nr:YSC84-related protein [Planctomycetia bacterium]
MRRTVSFLFLLAAVPSALAQADKERMVLKNAKEVLSSLADLPESGIPKVILDDAHGFLIVPDLVKVGFVVGGKHGRGVAVMKDEAGVWSNPVLIHMTGGSIGWQAGVESIDLVLVIRKKKTVEELLTARKFTLDANAGLAVGPLGRDLQAKTDVKFKAEMYSYSRSRGLFGGVSIGGGSLRVDQRGNRTLYGADVSPLDLARAVVTAPPAELTELKATLAVLSPPPPAPIQLTPVPVSPSPSAKPVAPPPKKEEKMEVRRY